VVTTERKNGKEMARSKGDALLGNPLPLRFGSPKHFGIPALR